MAFPPQSLRRVSCLGAREPSTVLHTRAAPHPSNLHHSNLDKVEDFPLLTSTPPQSSNSPGGGVRRQRLILTQAQNPVLLSIEPLGK